MLAFTVIYMVEIEEKLNISDLLGLYGNLLTEHQAEMMRLYFDCDISLFEISEQFGISRQAVRDALVRGEKTLKDTEAKLGLKYKLDKVRDDIVGVIDALDKDDCKQAKALAENTLSVLED